MKTHRTIPWLLVAVLLGGCFSGGLRRRADTSALDYRAPSAPAREAPRAALRASDAEDYRLAPRDQIVFEMFNEPDVTTTQRLSSQGEMTLPLIGSVELAGTTLREAEQAIRQRYVEGGFYVDPHVILSVAEYGAHFVKVLGQVNRPDRVELPIEATSIGLVEAITQAGGFTRLARTDAVQITRQTSEGGERNLTIDVRDYLRRGSDGGGDEFQLFPGDVVFVPERLF
jgi:polysaccharide export outer membrane protein